MDGSWKRTFFARAQFYPPKMPWLHQQTLGNMFAYTNAPPKSQKEPTLVIFSPKMTKIRFFKLSGSFQSQIWPFLGLKSVPNNQKWCLGCPQQCILMAWFVYSGLQFHWAYKKGRNWRKSQKLHFSGSFQRMVQPFLGLEITKVGSFWVLGGALVYANMFPNVCWCNQGILGG